MGQVTQPGRGPIQDQPTLVGAGRNQGRGGGRPCGTECRVLMNSLGRPRPPGYDLKG